MCMVITNKHTNNNNNNNNIVDLCVWNTKYQSIKVTLLLLEIKWPPHSGLLVLAHLFLYCCQLQRPNSDSTAPHRGLYCSSTTTNLFSKTYKTKTNKK